MNKNITKEDILSSEAGKELIIHLINKYTLLDGASNFEDFKKEELRQLTKQPLFKDYLGNEVFEGDDVYRVELEAEDITVYECWKRTASPISDYQYFKNKSDAEEYLINNARVLCLEDLSKYEPKDLIKIIKERLKLI